MNVPGKPAFNLISWNILSNDLTERNGKPPLFWEVNFLSRVRLFAIPWTVAYQAPPFLEFSRQEYWYGLPFPSPGDLPDPGIEFRSPALQADTLSSELPGKCGSVIFHDPLEEGMATHSLFLPGDSPWTEEPGGLQSLKLQRVRHDWATKHIRMSHNLFIHWSLYGHLRFFLFFWLLRIVLL